jgi:hypothetical protein
MPHTSLSCIGSAVVTVAAAAAADVVAAGARTGPGGGSRVGPALVQRRWHSRARGAPSCSELQDTSYVFVCRQSCQCIHVRYMRMRLSGSVRSHIEATPLLPSWPRVLLCITSHPSRAPLLPPRCCSRCCCCQRTAATASARAAAGLCRLFRAPLVLQQPPHELLLPPRHPASSSRVVGQHRARGT